MTRYAVGLGSNMGDRLGHLQLGAGRLGQIGDVVAVSSLYESAPVGGPDQDPFLNAVMVIDSPLGPARFLEETQRIEDEAGRARTVRWGPRTLDLDVITSDGDYVTEADLTIPHPRAAEREFVLRPLSEVWPEAPVARELTAEVALRRLSSQGVDRLAPRWLGEESSWLGPVFVGVQFAWFIGIALAMAWDGTLPQGDVGVVRVVGGGLAAAGALLAFIASRRLGPSLTALPEPRATGNLVVTGPYRFARHPIYGGVTVFILGASMIVDSLAGALLSLGLVPFFFLKSGYEERRLRIRYAAYRSYRHTVPRRLIPFLI